MDGGGSRRRGFRRGLLVTAWIGGLSLVVGLAIVGGRTSEPPTTAEASDPMTAAAASADASLRPSGGPRELIVRGRVARDAGIVRVRLEAADGLAIAIAPVDPTGHGHGDWVPFEARFLVARTYSSIDGGLFVVPMTVAGVGRASDVARYPFSSSIFLALDAIESGLANDLGERTPRRSFGNDGLLGGIVFGIPIEDR